jgi:preprotein translocase subunit SecF
LSFVDEQELEKLKLQKGELEHSLKVQEQLLKLQQDASNKQAIQSLTAYTKAASEGADKTQKAWKTVGSVLGGVFAAGGIAAAERSGSY